MRTWLRGHDMTVKQFGRQSWKNFTKTKDQEGLREVRKFRKNRKSNGNFPCLSNKCSKNSKNNKFNKILHLEREKVNKGFKKSANFAKIAKVTRIFLPMWKDWVTNTAKIAGITNFSKFYFYEDKRPRRASWSPQILQKSQK